MSRDFYCRRGGSRLFCKNGGLIHKEGTFLYKVEGGGGGTDVNDYGFRDSKALYSAKFSFRVFTFLINPFNTWACFYFE